MFVSLFWGENGQEQSPPDSIFRPEGPADGYRPALWRSSVCVCVCVRMRVRVPRPEQQRRAAERRLRNQPSVERARTTCTTGADKLWMLTSRPLLLEGLRTDEDAWSQVSTHTSGGGKMVLRQGWTAKVGKVKPATICWLALQGSKVT